MITFTCFHCNSKLTKIIKIWSKEGGNYYFSNFISVNFVFAFAQYASLPKKELWMSPIICLVDVSLSYSRKYSFKQFYLDEFSFSIHLPSLPISPRGFDFINVLRTTFTLAEPKSAKWQCWLDWLFCAFGIYVCKSCT